MMNFRTFILGLAASFGLPWLCLIVIPTVQYQHLAPIAYDKEKDGVDFTSYPPANINGQGQLVYIREGCNQCHTQMIRPVQLGLDGWYKGWGEDQEARPSAPVRPNVLRDYLGEKYALLGVQRVGPDLANYGWRAPDANALHQHLYAPRSVHEWSNMPAYPGLYKVQKIQGQVSNRALKLPKKFAPPAGYEVVPTPEADRLVEYLLSLKKAYPVPGQSAVAAAPAPASK
ncbi:MAG: cbb3-type cytochrome c oxidase subunit II [Prosthecobacter sp.]|jgi:cytochrome c oxidase cbb3-type subunit 2|uniref:cbb3-type cytochrome c oxidase subunit II n=1 Tax=Prosthecobacter sp. TaxID=1965333 RepID=UPI001A096354|nr:cbb3-type cytochrome c oxidase subunit II [Prosthecobacter sp.]MBE2284176.1 cbb3-type cytochrome c oxidase subunit II [Prosthecobacter sp.]